MISVAFCSRGFAVALRISHFEECFLNCQQQVCRTEVARKVSGILQVVAWSELRSGPSPLITTVCQEPQKSCLMRSHHPLFCDTWCFHGAQGASQIPPYFSAEWGENKTFPRVLAAAALSIPLGSPLLLLCPQTSSYCSQLLSCLYLPMKR